MSEAGGGDHAAEQGSAPNPIECRGPGDIGKIHHDRQQDIWYECLFDPRRRVYMWAIVPPLE